MKALVLKAESAARLGAGRPSETAMRMAVARAAHQIYDTQKVLVDPLAMRVIGDRGRERVLAPAAKHHSRNRLNTRSSAVARARYSEDAILDAVKRGIDQILVLGAGLDTFAYRAALPASVTVFELDHPSTQVWKKQRLAAAGIAVPQNVRFVAADLAKVSLQDALALGNFSLIRPVIVSWLGGTYYVPRQGVEETLRSVGLFAPGSELIVDYLIDPDAAEKSVKGELLRSIRSVSAIGEPWVTFFDPKVLAPLLEKFGFMMPEQFDGATLAARYGLDGFYAANWLAHATVRSPDAGGAVRRG